MIENTEMRPAKSGTTRSLLVFIHGYGANGADLIGLSDALDDILPDTHFLSPDGPDPCLVNPGGRQWFPVSFIDGSTEAQSQNSARRSLLLLSKFLNQEMKRHGVAADMTALFGFSQGAALALHLATQFSPQLSCVAGFSGRLLRDTEIGEEVLSRPPVLLVHGDSDNVIPAEKTHQAEAALSRAGVAVRTHISPETGHGIAPCGINEARRFFSEHMLN